MFCKDEGTMEQYPGDHKLFDTCKKMLYWQGFWPDSGERNLKFYMKYFSPRLANLLVKHRPLRLALHLFLKTNPWFIIISCLIHAFFLFPMAMFVNQNDPKVVMQLFLYLIIEIMNVVVTMTVFFKVELQHSLFDLLEEMINLEELDNEEQIHEFIETRSFGSKIIVFLVLFTGLLNAAFTGDIFFNLLPNRRFGTREWFPWDTSSSPAFEITLVYRYLQIITSTMIMITCVAVLYIALSLPRSNFKILNNKFVNIRQISMRRITSRKLKQSVGPVGNTEPRVQNEQGQCIRTTNETLPDNVNGEILNIANETRINIEHLLNQLDADDASRSMTIEAQLHGDQSMLGRTSYNEDLLTDVTQIEPLNDEEYVHLRSGAGLVQSSPFRPRRNYNNGSGINDLRLFIPLNAKRHLASLRVNNDMLTPSVHCSHLARNNPERTSMQVRGNEDDDQGSNCVLEITPQELGLEMNDVLAEDIVLHTKLTICLSKISDFLNGSLVILFVVNTLVLGVTALVFTKTDGETANKILSGTVLVIVTGVYLVCNAMIQWISDEHDAVTKSVYSCDWLEASPAFKKSMLVIMSRGNVPIEVKPVGLDPLSLKNFAQAMNASYKMVNTLKTVIK